MSAPAAARTMLRWFAGNGRRLPWRAQPDPYYVVVSEFMLQQTQVERVLPKFTAFVERFPDFATLARATRADVVRAWQGLGYNSRALRLHQLAQAVQIVHGGELPRDRAALLELPGVGPYTASAVRAFAFDLPEIALDTNIARVVQRVMFGVEYTARAAPAALDRAAKEFLAAGRARDLNGALMDLGASVCTARAPKCSRCPLRSMCAAAPIDAAALEAQRRAARPARPAPRKFEATERFARGRIVDALRALPAGQAISLLDLRRQLRNVVRGRGAAELRRIVAALAAEGLLEVRRGAVRLADS